MLLHAIESALPAVAHPLLTFVNGRPVRPSSATMVSGLALLPSLLPRLPPKANWRSLHSVPASRRAWRAAYTPISRAVIPSWRPNGWMPIPTMATSIAQSSSVGHGPKDEHHDLVAVGVGLQRDDGELHLH